MTVLYSWAKSRKISESIETMAPSTLDGVLQKFLSGSEKTRRLRVWTSLRTADVFPVVVSLPPKNNVCEPERQNDFHGVKPFVLVLANEIKG